ncbi:MAG TPA: MarR family transcriptional regulator [Thermoanaerobaculia bacterium]|nr:MarR family transcriptional regulator [Thermoanaerobaculia bacterium]
MNHQEPSSGPPRVSEEDYQTLSAFRYALRRFLAFSENAARQAGITPQQYLALLAVRGSPSPGSMTISRLAERLQIRHHSCVGLVNRLVQQGLLERRRCTDDRRQVNLTLTARGAELLEPLAAAHLAQLQSIGPDLRQVLERLG